MLSVFVAACGVLLAAPESIAHGRPESVALVAADPELARATAAALAAWEVNVIQVDAGTPGATMPEAANAAEAIAATYSARAVVWMTADGQPALWVYDVTTGRALALRLSSAPPFDEPTAAAVALTIKTLLRYGETAPPDERYVAARERRTEFALEASAVGCARVEPSEPWEPRLALTALYRPRWTGPVILAVSLRGGPGLEVEETDFVGHYTDGVLAVGARLDLAIGDRISVVPSLGLTLHRASLSGTSLSQMETADRSFTDPGGDAGVRLELQVYEGVRIATVAEVGYLFRRQRFLVGMAEVFDVPALGVNVGVALQVPLF